MLYLDGSKATFISKQRRELARLAEEVRDILEAGSAIEQLEPGSEREVRMRRT